MACSGGFLPRHDVAGAQVAFSTEYRRVRVRGSGGSELEALEKVTEKVDKLTVFGGLDGVMQDKVKLNVKAE